jgi:hypothetical protein
MKKKIAFILDVCISNHLGVDIKAKLWTETELTDTVSSNVSRGWTVYFIWGWWSGVFWKRESRTIQRHLLQDFSICISVVYGQHGLARPIKGSGKNRTGNTFDIVFLCSRVTDRTVGTGICVIKCTPSAACDRTKIRRLTQACEEASPPDRRGESKRCFQAFFAVAKYPLTPRALADEQLHDEKENGSNSRVKRNETHAGQSRMSEFGDNSSRVPKT